MAPDDSKQSMAALYSRVAPEYAAHGAPRFVYAGRRLVEVSEVGPGDRVLDLGTGRGAVLLPAAERVGPTGRAVGVDLADGMLQATSRALRDLKWTWASALRMDAEQLDFADASFTHVLGSFSVFFFPNLDAALAESERVLRPQGAIGFAFERDGDPRWAWYEDLLRERGAFERTPRMPGEGGRIRQPGALIDRLQLAGFADAHELEEEVDLPYRNAESWWQSLWTHGTRSALDTLSSDELAHVKAECLDRVRNMCTPNGELPETHRFVYVLARKPDS